MSNRDSNRNSRQNAHDGFFAYADRAENSTFSLSLNSIENLRSSLSGNNNKYALLHYASFSDLLVPYSTNTNFIGAPKFSAIDPKGGGSLHPFKGSFTNKSPYGSSLSNNFDENYNPNTVRSIGLKSPLILVGWGYDQQGFPVPNEDDENPTAKFKGPAGGAGINEGAAVDSTDYVAGPLDVRWDKERGVWSFETRTIYARITNSVEISSNQWVYEWQEINLSWDGEKIVYGVKSGGLSSMDSEMQEDPERAATNLLEQLSPNEWELNNTCDGNQESVGTLARGHLPDKTPVKLSFFVEEVEEEVEEENGNGNGDPETIIVQKPRFFIESILGEVFVCPDCED